MKYLVLVILMMGFVTAGCVDINSATPEELDEIVWIGPATAQKIIAERPFNSIGDLDRVGGIGPVKISEIKAEGLACVWEELEKSFEELEKSFEEPEKVDEVIRDEEPEKIVLSGASTTAIDLGGDSDSKIVYSSKNSKIMNYLPYVFSVFLILLLGILFWERF
jgi:hypothetical protein